MTYKCPKCKGIIETSEYSHPCRPQPRESLTHRLMMATVARHKKHNHDLQLAKAAFTVLRRFMPPRNDAASLRAWGYLNSVSQTAWTAALLETAHIQARPSRRWQDKKQLALKFVQSATKATITYGVARCKLDSSGGK